VSKLSYSSVSKLSYCSVIKLKSSTEVSSVIVA